MKKYYAIEFVYTDNGQMFGTGAFLDQDEKNKLTKILDAYAEAGAIEQQSITEPVTVSKDFDEALNEIMGALFSEVEKDGESECQNCGRIWPDSLLAAVEDLSMRVAPGEPMPSGGCRACGAVCQPVVAKA